MQLDHERLDVYQVSLDFAAWSYELAKRLKSLDRHSRDQRFRASQSITLNIAEGCGVTRPDRRHGDPDDGRSGSRPGVRGCVRVRVRVRVRVGVRVRRRRQGRTLDLVRPGSVSPVSGGEDSGSPERTEKRLSRIPHASVSSPGWERIKVRAIG